MTLELRTRPVGPWPMNTYVLACTETHASVLIDPGADPAVLRELLDGTVPVAILLTHTHADHVGELALMRRELAVPVLAFPGPRARGINPQPDQQLAHGDVIDVGNHKIDVFYTPGHSDDMLCFAVRDGTDIVVGDTIFAGGPGRTWSAADFATTLRTLREHVLRWPSDAVCHPGHGPSFRLSEVRPAIEGFVGRDHGDFFGDATWDS